MRSSPTLQRVLGVMILVLLAASSARAESADIEIPGLSEAIGSPPIARGALDRFLETAMSGDPQDRAQRRTDLLRLWDESYAVGAGPLAPKSNAGDAATWRDRVLAATREIARQADARAELDARFRDAVWGAVATENRDEWILKWQRSQRAIWLRAIVDARALREEYGPVVDVVETILDAGATADVDPAVRADAERTIERAIATLRRDWPRARVLNEEMRWRRENGDLREGEEQVSAIALGEFEALFATMRSVWTASAAVERSLPEPRRTELRARVRQMIAPELARSRMAAEVFRAQRLLAGEDPGLLEALRAAEEAYLDERVGLEASYGDSVLTAWQQLFARDQAARGRSRHRPRRAGLGRATPRV
jgi:hypothetical protein